MRLHGTTLRIALVVACIAILAMLPANFLMAQVVPPLPFQTGSVTGVVTTVGGAPASGIRVTAMRADATDDALRAMASLTQTDSTGRYRLESVPAGRYFIAAGRVDLPTYYPGTLELTKGTAISIASAATVTDIDFVILDTSAAPPVGAFGLRSGGPRSGGPAPGNAPLPAALNGLAGANFVQGRNSGAGTAIPPQAGQAPGRGGGAARSGGLGAGQNAGRGGGVDAGAAWWTNAPLVARLGLSEDQKKKVETTFESYRQTLVQNKAELERQESVLARMLETEPMEPQRSISAQIERVIMARAEMERTNSKMTLEIRQNLTRTQWVQLQMETLQPVVIVNTPAGGRSGGRGGPALPPPPPPALPPASPQR